MARYNLIMKDETYMILLKKAASQGLTMGKYINIILNEAAMGEVIEKPKTCKTCGKPAKYKEEYLSGSRYVCGKHKDRSGRVPVEAL